jgi:hypothetical protein
MADLSNASNDLFFKLRNRFPKIRLGDENGVTTIDPEASRFFNFRYVDKQSERDYGEVTCSLIDGNSMKVFFDNAITERMLPEDKDYWYRFLRELRRYAKSHMLNFDVRDISKDVLSRRDYEFLAKTNPEKKKMKESLEESRVLWQRKGKVSEGSLNNVRIHVVHNERMLENPNNRLLKVDRIFLVNESGEKFLLPFKSVSGAKAMANHVSRGGNPYDSNGQIISRAVNEMRNLGRFASATRSRTFEAAEASNVIRAAQTVKENLKRHLNRLSNNSRRFDESLQSLAEFLGEQVDDVTEVKAWFTQQTYNENLDNYLASAAGAYKKLRENTLNKLDEVSDSVKNKILNPKFKLLLKADAGLDKLMTSRNYTDSKAMAVAILGDIANRLVAPDSDDVANFAALMGDLMSSEGEAFGQKADDKEYTSDKKLAILLAQKYLKELNLIKQNPKLEREYRQDTTRKPEKIKGKKTESEAFAEEIMSIGEEASVEDITDAISHRLMSSGAANKMLRAHGLDKVLDAIHSVAQDHVGAQEIGTSDVSAMVNQVMQTLGMREDAVSEEQIDELSPQLLYKSAKVAREKIANIQTSRDAIHKKILDIVQKNFGYQYDQQKDGSLDYWWTGKEDADANQIYARLKEKNPHDAQRMANLYRMYWDLDHKKDAIANQVDRFVKGAQHSSDKELMPNIKGPAYNPESIEEDEVEESGLQYYTGKKKYGKDGMAALAKAGREGASQEELGKIKDKYMKEEETDEGIGKTIAAGALAAGLGAGAASMTDSKPVPYMIKPDAKGGYEIVLKRNPSRDVFHAKTEDEARAWIKKAMESSEHVNEEPNEGNEFSGALAAAKAAGKKEFEVDGKTYQVKEGGSADKPEHEDSDADDKRYDDKEDWYDADGSTNPHGAYDAGGHYYPERDMKETKETKMSKEVMEMRKLAGLPLMENYIYAQEEDDNIPQDGEPSDDDKAEYDQEGRMAKNDLAGAADAAKELEAILQDDENLPEWVQAKITKALDYLDTARDYMKHNDVEYTDEAKVDEAKAKPDFLDVDKDGDKKEPFKKAVKDKKEKTEESVKADLRWMQAVAGIVIK